MRPLSLHIRYAAGLTLAFVLSAAESIAIVVSLGDQAVAGAQSVFTERNLVATAALVVASAAGIAVGGVLIVWPLLGWQASGREPTAKERRTALNISWRQTLLLSVPWWVGAAVLVPMNLQGGPGVGLVIGFSIMFGLTASMTTGFLFTQRTLRPLLAAGAADLDSGPVTPGVRGRLIMMWTLCTALPGLAIVLLIMMRRYGWIIAQTASVDAPVLVLAMVAVMLGARSLILVSRSISDPVHEVVDAMAQVEQGRIDHTIDVYERSEIGRLQSGFNQMVAGLQERDRLRDLFGRHVGEEVMRRAIDENESVSEDEREVAILFVDLVDSTKLATDRPPHEVADVLNDFFRIVVAQVDARRGLINKFQGDAALAVFGAPLRVEDPATAALMTARALGNELRCLPVDFGIGVAAGPVFAGNIGAENRYEYTVVGDAVNEAARLADRAKQCDARVLCSGAALHLADAAERERWVSSGTEVLRGRAEPTEMSAPAIT